MQIFGATVFVFFVMMVHDVIKPMIGWDLLESRFSQLRQDHEYALLMDELSLLIDKEKDSRIFSFIKQAVDCGDVAMTYLYLRNFAAMSQKAVLRSQDWDEIAQYIIISIVRIQQDVACCNTIAHEYINESILGGLSTWYYSDPVRAFKLKMWYWFGTELLKQPFDTSVQAAVAWFEQTDYTTFPAPIWVRYMYPKTFTQTKKIIFATPNKTQLKVHRNHDFKAAMNKERKACCAVSLEALAKLASWEQFFKDIIDITQYSPPHDPESASIASATASPSSQATPTTMSPLSLSPGAAFYSCDASASVQATRSFSSSSQSSNDGPVVVLTGKPIITIFDKQDTHNDHT